MILGVDSELYSVLFDTIYTFLNEINYKYLFDDIVIYPDAYFCQPIYYKNRNTGKPRNLKLRIPNYMNEDVETLDSAVQAEDSPLKLRLTPPQKRALRSAYELNTAYAKRWFTACELSTHVVPATLEALASKGLLEMKPSEVNPDVRYYRATGKGFEMFFEE